MQEINVTNLLTAITQAQKEANKDGVNREIKLSDYAKIAPSCDICAKRQTCKKSIGAIWGYCKNDFTPGGMI